ncbi:MAG: TMEM43 family protein [Planctomycetota bacterium]
MGLFRRRKNPLAAFAFGGIMSIAAFPMLFLNEGRAVKTAKALKEGAAAVVSVDANHVESSNDGEFVHMTGMADTSEVLKDDQFGVELNAIRLVRNVEMYQWVEYEEEVKRRDNDGNTSKEIQYGYEKEWTDKQVDSSRFNDSINHQNPAALPFRSTTTQAKEVFVGEYRLPTTMVEKIDNSEPVIVDLAKVDESLTNNTQPDGGTPSSANGIYWSVDGQSNPSTPAIGDVRVRFSVTKPTEVSLMAQQTGNTLKPFEAHSGRKLSMLSLGTYSAEEMIDKAEAENTALTWALRVMGTMLLVIGIGLLFQPLTSMVSWIPMLGNLVGMGAFLVAILLGGGLALGTIGIAWVFYRPVMAAILIGLGAAMMFALFRNAGKNSHDGAIEAEPVM